MLTKTEAIVLHSFKFGENKIIVDLFAKSTGRMSVIASLSKSPKAKIKKQIFQPLTILEITVDVRKSALPKLADARIGYPFISIPFDPFKVSISLFLAEFLNRSLRAEQQDEPLYTYILNSIVWLDSCTDSFSNFHLVFAMRLSRFLGFFPNLDDYAEGAFFDLRAGCFSMTAPMHRDFLQPQLASLVVLMMRMNFSNIHLFRFSHDERNRILDIILYYYRLHLPDFPELKSVSILRELFID